MPTPRDALLRLAPLLAIAGCDAGPFVRTCAPDSACALDASLAIDVPPRDITALDVETLFTDLVDLQIQPADAVVVARGEPVLQAFSLVGVY